jgi:hypothetical protein
MIRRRGKVTISEILRGCTAGRMQTVGAMQVIPLLSEIQDHRFVSPLESVVSTGAYGQIDLENRREHLVLVPSDVAYVVPERVQDHALTKAKLVAAGKVARFKDAMCIEESQPGLIRPGRYRFAILPVSLRRHGHKTKDRNYSRLWAPIRAFKKDCGLTGKGNLSDFLKHYRRQLDEFVAEFETVPGQVGAIVLIHGKVIGVERAPNHAYWADVWEPLIRECYGSHAIRLARAAGAAAPRHRTSLREEGIESLDDLEAALEEAEAEESEAAREQIRSLLDAPFKVKQDSTLEGLSVESVRNDQLIGQIVREGETVLYASLVVHAAWERKAAWKRSKPFEI